MFFDNSSNNWSKTLFLANRALDTSYLRNNVIADNIANVDVPHFKRSEVTFEAQLRRALQSEEYVKKEAVPTRFTDKRHIPFFRPLDYKQVQPKTHVDYQTTMRNDGNNIDMEHETSEFLKNQLRYQLLTDLASQKLNHIQMVMQGV